MVGLALGVVQGALLLAVAGVGLMVGSSWGRILHVVVLTWLLAPVVGLLFAGAVHLRLSAASAGATRPAADPRLVGAGR